MLILIEAISPEQACLPTDVQIRVYGYRAERHSVVTQDGYILTIFRILTAEKNPWQKEPLVMAPGVASSSDCFLANGTYNPPFFFVKKGFDVWLLNVRGTQYSQHQKYSREDPQFWNYTFEEIGLFDIPAGIEYILSYTKSAKVTYYGISQGVTSLVSAFSLNPHFFSDRIGHLLFFSPVLRLDLTSHDLILLASYFRLPQLVMKLGITHLMEFTKEDCIDKKKLCEWASPLCRLILLITGDVLPFKNHNIGFSSEATSMKVLAHFAKIITSGAFVRYWSDEIYDLNRVQGVKTAMFVGGADSLATRANAEQLRQSLQRNGALRFYKVYPGFGHNSFHIIMNSQEFLQDALGFIENE